MNMGLLKKMMNNENVVFPIYCVGVDEKRHLCIPWKDETLCGLPIKFKDVADRDLNKWLCNKCFPYNW